ncbi:MAG: radical SAM protein [Rhodospirillaceae bacterium]|jgi:MoaA/NifB/PqqE/SkfB family radical SAM enzyme|nr:radical SAM protein [Rhodospirillaceae bacterium]
MALLYSNLKFLDHPEHLSALREQRVVAPVHIRIKPMNYCNHNCWYCAYRYDSLQLGEDMDVADQIPHDKIFEIVEDIIDMGVKAVTFSGGGEPLLYKPLPDVISQLANADVKISSLTNGANLKGKVADAFAEHATWVRVSLDGWDDASYAKSRNIKEGDFSKLLDNMKNFIDSGTKCVLGVSMIIDNVNFEHVYDVCSLMKDIDVNHVKLSPVVVGNSVEENNAYHALIKETVGGQVERAAELQTDDFTVLDHYHELPDLFDKGYDICPFLQYLTVIGGDCRVYTCQDKAFTEGGLLGSIEEKRFKDFWFSEENRKNLFTFNPRVSCQHHCVTHSKNLALMEFLSLDQDHSHFV